MTPPEPSPAFKVKVALATVHGEQALAELTRKFEIHLNQIKQWSEAA